MLSLLQLLVFLLLLVLQLMPLQFLLRVMLLLLLLCPPAYQLLRHMSHLRPGLQLLGNSKGYCASPTGAALADLRHAQDEVPTEGTCPHLEGVARHAAL